MRAAEVEEASDILSPLNPNRMAAHGRHSSVVHQPLTPGVASGIVASANIENKGLRKGRWRRSIGGTPCRDAALHRTDPVERLLVASVTKHRRWTALNSPAASEASTTDAWSDAELQVVTD